VADSEKQGTPPATTRPPAAFIVLYEITKEKTMEFKAFQKITRLSRDIIVTEKIDGTNGVIAIGEDGEFAVGSRSRFITPENDNAGFAKWAYANKDELMKLGPGFHYGEWWGNGIQRNYGLKEKRFSLFNVSRWGGDSFHPACCNVVPVLFRGPFDTSIIDNILVNLKNEGSVAAPGFMRPEGVVIFHAVSGYLFKKTIERDEYHKGE
jgi:hypothetical protein